MEWFRNCDSNQEFEKYVEQLPEGDQKILRDYLIPIIEIFRDNISALADDRAKVLEEALNNNPDIIDLYEQRKKKVGNVIRKAIDFIHNKSFLADNPPVGSTAHAKPKETAPSSKHTEVNYNEERIEHNLLAALTEYKQEGNQLFRGNEFKKAIFCYSKAIELDPSDPVYFNNRALCYLKLKAYECAMADAEKAVSINPLELKYRYSLAQALSGLGDHEKSCELLEKVCLTNPNLYHVLEKEKILLGNLSGNFDFAELEAKAARKEPLEIADFIGRVAIAQSSVGSYSVCCASELGRGDCVLVSKAVVYSSCACNQNESTSPNTDEHMANLVKALADKAEHSELAAHRIYHLFYRNPKENPVSIELYRATGHQLIRDKRYPAYCLEDLGLAVKKIFYAVTAAESSDAELGRKKTARGVWYLPSFINHSCLPTGHQYFIGDISVVCVSTQLCAGSEITLSRIPVYDCVSVEERRELLKRWGIECHCKLCEFESDPSNSELLQRIAKIRTKSLRLSSLIDNPLQIIGSPEYELFTELLSIANELQLGPQMFNAAFWHAVIALTKLLVAPNDSSIYFDFINKIEAFICVLESTHQQLLWKNVLSYFDYIKLPEKDKKRVEVGQKYQKVKRKFH